MCMVDLHTHSSCSDGQYTPAEVVRRAAEAGVTHMALTDHDTAEGVSAAQAAAKAYGLRFMAGIELSTAGRPRQHILGYGVQPEHSALQDACSLFTKRRLHRAEQIAQLLRSQGIAVTVEEAAAEAKGQLGRPHFARVLIKKGYVCSVSEAFERYLATPAVRAIPDPKPTAEEAIALIHQAGGVAVLAHPFTLGLSEHEFPLALNALCRGGLDGVEVFYPKHTAAQVDFFLSCAKARSLLITGGSDYHGEAVKPDIALGMSVPSWLTEQSLPFFSTV